MKYLIPEKLQTHRLYLRMFKEDDWGDLHKYYSDIECTKYTIQTPLTEGESWRTMAGMIGHWHLRGYGPYSLEDKESGTVLGVAGLWYPHDWPEPEIKWGLSRSYWGKGYATEAGKAVKNMALKELPDLSLISLIFSGNKRSENVARALGATFEKEIEFRGLLANIYRHSRKPCELDL